MGIKKIIKISCDLQIRTCTQMVERLCDRCCAVGLQYWVFVLQSTRSARNQKKKFFTQLDDMLVINFPKSLLVQCGEYRRIGVPLNLSSILKHG